MTRSSRSPQLPFVLLALLVAANAALRYRELDWGMKGHPDFAHSQHSDETRKIGYTLELGLSLEGMRPDPWLLVKGTLLPSVGRVVHEIAGWEPLSRLFERSFGTPLGGTVGTYLLFRSVSAFSSLVLVLLVFALARALSGSGWAGLLAAFFQTTAFGSAYAAVTFKSDMLAATLLAAVCVVSVAYVKRPGPPLAAAMGATLGLAIAAKHLAVIGAALPVIACLTAGEPVWRTRLARLCLAGVSSALLLALSAPYYVLEPGRLWEALQVTMRYQAERSYHFEGFGVQPAAVITHLLASGLGPVLTGLGLAGAAHATVRWWRGEKVWGPLLGYGLAYIFVLSLNAWLVVRYTVPLHPLLSALAAVAVWSAVRRVAARRRLVAGAGLALLAGLVLAQAAWFAAYDRLLTEPSPPARAAAWLKDSLPSDSRILELRRRPPVVYGFGAQPQAVTALRVDGLIEEGRRLSALPFEYVVLTEEMYRHFFRLPDERYAPYREFYGELFDRRLFRPVARFETRLQVAGIELPTPFLPEDVLLVSPVTWVFRKVARNTPAR